MSDDVITQVHFMARTTPIGMQFLDYNKQSIGNDKTDTIATQNELVDIIGIPGNNINNTGV